MRIIICVLNLYGGGAERVASLWARGFYDEGHEVLMLLDNNKVLYDIPPIEVRCIGKQNCNIIRRYFNWYVQIRKYLKEFKPDIFISVNHPWAIIAKIASIGQSIKIISTEHNSFEKPPYVKMGLLDNFHKFFLNKFVDSVTVLTQADKDYIGSRLNNVHVLPNPLAYKPLDSIPSKNKVILSVGRLDSWHVKGFDLLVTAWANIADLYPEWQLKIIGYGKKTNKDYLSSLAPSIVKSNQLVFEDFTPNIVDYYKDSMIYVLSSRYEGFGMGLLEAISQGCVCIACDYKGRQREIIRDGIDGVIIDTDSTDAISRALSDIINNRNIISRYQLNAIERSKEFSLGEIMKIWNMIIR